MTQFQHAEISGKILELLVLVLGYPGECRSHSKSKFQTQEQIVNKIIIAAGIVVMAATQVLAQSKDSGDMKTPPQVFTDKAKIEGNAITGLVVIIDKPGFAVIHNDAVGAPPNHLGYMYVEPGETRDLRIETDTGKAIDPDSGVTVMLHYDTNDNHTLDFGPGSTDVDTPVSVNGTVVNTPVKSM